MPTIHWDRDLAHFAQSIIWGSNQTYTLSIFAPLNFLGTVDNAVIMAAIDLANMTELLAENPDVVDAPDALQLPTTVDAAPEGQDDVAIEFDNVIFHYPTQPEERGLKGLSFQMKRGTTIAIVGPVSCRDPSCMRISMFLGTS